VSSERNQQHVWNTVVVSYSMMPGCHPKVTISFFDCRIYSLWSALCNCAVQVSIVAKIVMAKRWHVAEVSGMLKSRRRKCIYSAVLKDASSIVHGENQGMACIYCVHLAPTERMILLEFPCSPRDPLQGAIRLPYYFAGGWTKYDSRLHWCCLQEFLGCLKKAYA
jgi:hypothetical protein